MAMRRLAAFLLVMAVIVGAGRHLESVHSAARSDATLTPVSDATAAAEACDSAGIATHTTHTGDPASTASPQPVSLASGGWDPAQPHAAPIPEDALRLRIIANSDSPADQALKEAVRDKVVMAVAGWLRGAKDAGEAKAIVVAHLPQIRAIAEQEVHARGYHYAVRADVGRVPFPTKVYGNMVYPAGDYEALRITIGAGQGQNWWCVLFPPLCFIEIADGDAVPNTAGFPDLPPLETIQVPTASGGTTEVQVRVAAVDYGETLWRTVAHWLGL